MSDMSVNDILPGETCLAARVRLGRDVIVEERDGYTLAHCVGEFSHRNIHASKWMVWDANGKLMAVGDEAWARKRFDEARDE